MVRFGSPALLRSSSRQIGRGTSTFSSSPSTTIHCETQRLFLKRASGAGLLLVCLFTQAGCTPLKVNLGWKVYLEKTPVSSIQAKLPNGPGIAPGQKSPLVVTFAEPNGKVLATEGKGGGKVMWKELAVTADVVKVNQKGVVSLAHDPRKSDGKTGHVTITVPSHPDMRADLDVPFQYDVSFVANFSGNSGSSGLNGTDGSNGMSGSMGSTDLNNPSAGGNGSDGGDGTNGGDGSGGGDARPVQVRVTLRPGSHPMLEAKVSAGALDRFFLIDTQGGSLTVRADGGAGGSGGRGGRAGHGGSGGIGSPNGSSGRDGTDGRSGFDGSQGRGGRITVVYDPAASRYLGLIHLSSQNGPAPAFQQEPVAALW